MFDASSSKCVNKTVSPVEQQEEYESQRSVLLFLVPRRLLNVRLWSKVTEAIRKSDQAAAQGAKSAVEDRQREIAKKREAAGEVTPDARFFQHVTGDRWMPKLDINK